MWLNLVTSTKLPTYPKEGSSHHVVQQIFFFFDNFLLDDFFVFFFLINFFFFSAWLNLAKDTKLPTYPRKGSSHYVVQKIFFFLCVFAKRRAQGVILGITTNRTQDGLKGDMDIQPLHHTSNWWHRVGLISLYWYAFKGNGKTSCTLAVLQWAV